MVLCIAWLLLDKKWLLLVKAEDRDGCLDAAMLAFPTTNGSLV
jgi:hypothetical protein